MRRDGAPAQAIAFARATGNQGYLEKFRDTGRVAIAYAYYPIRANEPNVWFLVNGHPDMIDVSDTRLLPPFHFAEYPTGAIFPGDREPSAAPIAVTFGDKSQEFVVDYTLRDGCHACAVLGLAYYAFHFDPAGKFKGATFSEFAARGASQYGKWPVTLNTSQTMTVWFPSQSASAWRIATDIRNAPIRVDRVERRSGEQGFHITPLQPGDTELAIQSVSPARLVRLLISVASASD